MADSNVNIRINAQNNASPAIKQVNTDLSKMDKAAGTAAGGISGLAKVAGAAGLVAFGVQAAQAAVELANLGNQSIAMRASFEQLAGGAENATTILESLTQASRGTISQYDLMLTANRAMLLGVADSAEEFNQLMQIAAVRGRAMGLSTTQAFNDIVTGLGRESKLILDNLGILIDLEGAQTAYAATLGKTAAELTDAERKQALVNQVIESSADLLRDANSNAKAFAGEGMAQLNTAWTDFRTALGESLGPILEARAKELADFLAGATNLIDEWRNEDTTVFAPQLANQQVSQAEAQLADLQRQLIDYTQNASSNILDWADLLGLDDNDPAVLQRYQAGLDAIVSDIVRVQAELDKLTGKQQAAAKAAADAIAAASNLGGLSDATRPDISAEQNLLGIQSEIKAALQLYQDASASLAEANRQGNTAAADVAKGYIANLIPTIRTLANEYNGLADTLGRVNIVGVSFGNGEIIYQTVEALEAEKKAAEDAAKAIELIGEAGNKLDGLYDTLLDTGNIDNAKSSFETIRSVIQDITEAWVAQGVPIEDIQNTLLPKLIAEIDNLIGKQIEAGDAGITAGELIGSGFLSSLPGIETIIDAVGRLTGATIAAGESIRAVQRQAGASLSQFAPGRGTRGAGDAFANGLAASLGRSQVDRGFGGLGGELSRRNAGIGGRGIVGGVGAALGGGGGSGSIDNEAQKLANRLTSILNGALKSGIDLDSILPRQDAIEEPARRLADIAVRGFESPWVDYIKNTFPEIWGEIENAGDPKQAAANILRDFEDGLRPELLDKGRAKELVKRALLGEQNTAALAAEIAAELSSELGVSLQQAQEAAAGVLGSGAGTGTGDGTGMDGGVAAASFTDAFIGTMGAMLERFKGAGNSAGAQWGIGFMGAVEGGVPSQLIGLLVTLITPGVMANMAAGSSRTGAS